VYRSLGWASPTEVGADSQSGAGPSVRSAKQLPAVVIGVTGATANLLLVAARTIPGGGPQRAVALFRLEDQSAPGGQGYLITPSGPFGGSFEAVTDWEN
jgi:hypothetical protein